MASQSLPETRSYTAICPSRGAANNCATMSKILPILFARSFGRQSVTARLPRALWFPQTRKRAVPALHSICEETSDRDKCAGVRARAISSGRGIGASAQVGVDAALLRPDNWMYIRASDMPSARCTFSVEIIFFFLPRSVLGVLVEIVSIVGVLRCAAVVLEFFYFGSNGIFIIGAIWFGICISSITMGLLITWIFVCNIDSIFHSVHYFVFFIYDIWMFSMSDDWHCYLDMSLRWYLFYSDNLFSSIVFSNGNY